MTEASPLPSHIALADELLAKSTSPADIEKQLSEAGFSTDDIAAALDHLHLSPQRGHSNTGALLIGLGVILCLVGFVVLITSTHEGLTFDIALYGLTGSGATSIVGGMAMIFG